LGNAGTAYGSEATEMPFITEALVLSLKARFPIPIPEVGQLDREIWLRRGAWSVIEFLESTLESQNNVHVKT
jgi:hypothetical protein